MKKIVMMFAGQGAQSVGMGKSLYDSSPAAKAVFDMGEAIMPGILDITFSGPGETLTQTEYTQPALFLTDLAVARAVEEAGIRPDAVAGFSLGEIAALAFAGVLSDEDAFRLVVLRGKTMAECAARHPGGMAAVLKMENRRIEEIASHYKEIYPVNYNCPGQLACAGSVSEIDAFCAEIKAAGGRAVKLAVSGAFHTPYMKAATEALKGALASLDVHAPAIPLYSNLTGALYPSSRDEIIEIVSMQASNAVRWESILRALDSDGAGYYIEVGAGKTLSGFVSRTLPEAQVCRNIDTDEALLELKAFASTAFAG